MPTFGRIEEFSGKAEDLEVYLERLEEYLLANDLVGITVVMNDNRAAAKERNDKRRAILLSVIGQSTYTVLRNLVLPEKLSAKSYKELTDLLIDHFTPRPAVSVQRFKFYKREKRSDETVSQYISELRKIAENCEFGTTLEDMLRDKLVCGVHDERVQRRLFVVEKLTFKAAYDIVLAQEQAGKSLQMLQGAESVKRVEGGNPSRKKFRNFKGDYKPKDRRNDDRKPCSRCGFTNHDEDHCKYKTHRCYVCKQIGHLKSMCPDKNAQTAQSERKVPSERPQGQQKHKTYHGRPGKVRYVDNDATYDDDGDSYNLADSAFTIWCEENDSHIRRVTSSPFLCVTIDVAGVEMKMEVDTGAGVSIINAVDYRKWLAHVPLRSVTKTFTAYGGNSLPVLGVLNVPVRYGETHATLPLYVIDVQKHAPPLLGREWLRHIRLDWTKLLQQSGDTVHAVRSDGLHDLLEHYGDLFSDKLGTVKGVTAKLHLKPDARPVYHKARSVPYALREAVDAELKRMESEGIIYPVDYSHWSTPLVSVPKTDGTVRLCGDYKVSVNPMLEVDQFPIPTPESVFRAIENGQKFTKLDLRCAYQQLLLDEQSQELATINTPKGLYRYTRLPYGIASSPAIWQRFIDQVLSGLTFTCAIMDDVLVSGVNDYDHLKNLEKVFERFRKYGLRLKKEKCMFMKPSVVYMGRRISADGIQPTEDKVAAIKEAPVPQNVTQLRSWLGMVNFQAQFIPHLSSLCKPMNDLLGKQPWKWTKQCQEAFQSVKDAMVTDSMLRHFKPNRTVEMACDASPYGVAAVILQPDDNGVRKPVAYASRSLNKHEQGYAQMDREGLAIIFGLRRFHMYLYGRPIVILTDNKAIEHILSPTAPVPTLAAQRLQRWAIMLSAFNYQLKYITSEENVLADALSRLPRSMPDDSESDEDAVFHVEIKRLESLPITWKEIAAATKRDSVLSTVLRYVQQGWPEEPNEDLRLQPYANKRLELTAEEGCLLWGLRVIIPPDLQNCMLDELHSSHAGIVKTKEIARSYVWWPKLDQDIERMVRECGSCQKVKNVPAMAPLSPWVWPGVPWCRVHIDYAEKDKKNYLVIVDAYSKWPEVILMNSTTSKATISELQMCFARYGFPRQVVSDNGPQFRSEEFTGFLKQNGIKHIRVAPYHAASNGLAERMVQTFKRSLCDGRETQEALAVFLMNYRATKHTTTGRTPAELFIGRQLRTRLDLVRPDVNEKVLTKQSEQKDYHDKRSKNREFYTGESVYVRDVVKNTWLLGTVTSRTGPMSYIVQLHDGRLWKRHVDHVRSAHVCSEQIPSAEPRSNELDLSVDINFDAYDKSHSNAKRTTPAMPQSVSDPVQPPIFDDGGGGSETSIPMPTRSEKSSVKSSVVPDGLASQRPSRVSKKPKRLIEVI